METEFDEELYESKMQYVRQLLDEIEAKDRSAMLDEESHGEEAVNEDELVDLLKQSKLARAQEREYSTRDRFYLFRTIDSKVSSDISPEKEKALIMHSQIPNTVRRPELELYLALISPNDIEIAKEKIKKINNLNFKVYNEPLIEFCYRHNNIDGIELLIDKGYDLLQIDPKLLSKILFIEITNKNEKYYDAILDAEADVNYKTANGRTLLGYALRNDDAVLGRKLLNRGAKVCGDAELWYAVMERKFNFAKLLLENGAKIDRYVLYWTKLEGTKSSEGREFKRFLIDTLKRQKALEEQSSDQSSESITVCEMEDCDADVRE